MIKQVPVGHLKVGMYIHDLGASWFDHPFLANHFLINDQVSIDKIKRSGIYYVSIDTRKGGDCDEAVLLSDVEKEIHATKHKVAKAHIGLSKEVSFDKEIYRAREIMREARKVVHSFMDSVRRGHPIDVDDINHVVEEITESVFRNKDALINLGRIKQKDQYTFLHSISVCVLMTTFARAMEFDEEMIRQVAIGGLLHDIGKMKVPDEILNKPDKLDNDEFLLMRQHVEHAMSLLSGVDGMSSIAKDIVLQHHERNDGTGYPCHLLGDEISTVGKMAAIVDVYDALTSVRCYKNAWEPTYALGKLLEWAGSLYEEKLVHQFIRCVGIYPVGTLVRLSSGIIAVVVEQNEGDLLLPRVRKVFDGERGRYITPEDLDLENQEGVEEKIVEVVPPTQVHVDPQAFL